MPLLELTQVHKSYEAGERRVTALNGIDLTIDEGEFVALWGPSGSGKSTLCNLIGLLDHPTTGTVRLQGRDVTGLPDDTRSDLRNRTIGFIFQNFNLLPVLSALENVMLPLQIGSQDARRAEAQAASYLRTLSLAEHMDRRPDQLSGGQQQRVAIARALVTNPSIVIADEPTANLDSDAALAIIDTMRQLNRERGVTFVFSTHDQRLLTSVDRRVQLRDGKVADDARP